MKIDLPTERARWLSRLLESLDYDDLDDESASAEVEQALADALLAELENQP